MKNPKIIGIILFLCLFWISFYKDDITPDYKNTPNALFLDPGLSAHGGNLTTLVSHRYFWIVSFAYSGLFILLPWAIILFLFDKKTAMIAGIILCGFFLVEYALVFIRIPVFSDHVLPKVNRYFHSPIITFFMIAAFTLNNRKNGSD